MWGGPSGGNDSEVSYIRFSFMHSSNVKFGVAKANLDETGVLGQQPLDDVDVDFVAVPAGRMVAVYVPVSVYEIVHITVVLFTTRHNIVEINCFCFG